MGILKPRRLGTIYLLPAFTLSLLPVEWPEGGRGRGEIRKQDGLSLTGHLHSMG